MGNTLRLDADLADEVAASIVPAHKTSVQLPIAGPIDANRLLILSGMASVGFEIPAADRDNGIATEFESSRQPPTFIRQIRTTAPSLYGELSIKTVMHSPRL